MTATDLSIAIAEIAESPTNPRHTLTDADVADLAASIKQDGILQPLLVRPASGGKPFQLVFGHRRLRAARLAKLTHVPCRVRKLDDATVARMQLVENMQREGLHALDEADGLLALHKTHGMTIEQLVQQTGKSRTAIYARLKLVTLQPDAREAFRAGKMDAEIALLVARVPPGAQQTAALKVATEAQWDGAPPSYRKVRGELLQRFTEGLKSAPFDIADATLLEGISPQPIACTACPRRTGAASEVFADVTQPDDKASQYQSVKGPDVCTDPACYDAKKRVTLKRQAAALAARGKTVLTGPAAAKAVKVDPYTKRIEVKGDYVALADVRAALKGKAAEVRAALKGKAAEVEVVTVQHASGKTVQAVKKADLQAAGVKVAPASKPRQEDSWEKRNAKLRAAAERETAVHLAVWLALQQALPGSTLTAEDWRALARHAGSEAGSEHSDVDEVRQLTKEVGTLDDVPALQRAALLLSLEQDIEVGTYNVDQVKKSPPPLLAIAQRHGVDVAAIRARQAVPEKPDEQAKAAAKKPVKAAAKKATAKPKSESVEKPAPADRSAPKTEVVPVQAWPFPKLPAQSATDTSAKEPA